jgi:hypothetical protein
MENETHPHPASFRDPSGSIFLHAGELFRKINRCYRDEFDAFLRSGLYERLVRDNLIVSHREVSSSPQDDPEIYRIIQPEGLPFISYPYEWCFSQLKDAALLTLRIQKTALEYGLTLKDASAYNVQYRRGRPVFIDTLSFERYREGSPWVAYRQFCQHFLAPLALMSQSDARLNQLARVYLDGIPLDLTSSLLPRKTFVRLPLALHIHFHARMQNKFSRSLAASPKEKRISKARLQALIDSLEALVLSLKWKTSVTEWSEYPREMNYSPDAWETKISTVGAHLKEIEPSLIWDLGANTGVFSRLAAVKKVPVVAIDGDAAATEKNYLNCREKGEEFILPLIADLVNPSPGIGWLNEERTSLIRRGPADCILALALFHHLAIVHNLPFGKIADFLAAICRRWLIIEFVPQNDSWVRSLLSTRKNMFPDYSRDNFEKNFLPRFRIITSRCLPDSERILYFFEKREPC